MRVLTPMAVVPFFYFLLLAILLFRREWRGIGESVLCFAAAMLAGGWAITRSRASTAGIGFLFLPSESAIVGLLGLAFGRWRSSPLRSARVGSWLALIVAVGFIGAAVWGGVQTNALTAKR